MCALLVRISEPNKLIFAPRRAEERETDGDTGCGVYSVGARTADGDVVGVEAEGNCEVKDQGVNIRWGMGMGMGMGNLPVTMG